MLNNKSERILLVAPNVSSIRILAGNKQIWHIMSADRVFPSIYELHPGTIIFDYDCLSDDIEKILRRIRTNSFYKKIKICCFKSSPNPKTDSFLKVLGVNQVIYKNDPQNPSTDPINSTKSVLDPLLSINW